MTSYTIANDVVNMADRGRKKKYVVPALRQKRKECFLHSANRAVHDLSKFYHDSKKVTHILIGEIPIQISPTDEVEPKFRTPPC